MLDLKKIKLPSTIEVEGSFFNIKTDFQYWIMFSSMLQNRAPIIQFDYIYEDIPPIKLKLKAMEKLVEFFSPKRELPRNVGGDSGKRALDYELDSDLIYSAFMERYHIDLLDEKLHLHWHKFLALLSGLHSSQYDSKLSEVISYRSYNPNSKSDYKKDMLQLQRAWELPSVLTEEEKEALAEFDAKFS